MAAVQDRHPVWDVYNELRTARLNVLYYTNRAAELRQHSLALDILTGLAGSTVLVSLIPSLQLRGAVTIAGAVVAIVGPVLRNTLQLPEKAKECTEVARDYDVTCYDLERLRRDIRTAGQYSQAHIERFIAIEDRRGVLITKEPDRIAKRALAERCQAQVNREYPLEGFYVPPL